MLSRVYGQPADAAPRWTIDPEGGITWLVKASDAHQDQIEMSGKKVSLILTYAASTKESMQAVSPWALRP